MRALALRYALAPACVLLAVLVQLSPVGALFPFGGLFVLAVVGAAWFGGAGPGFLAATLGALALPQLITVGHTGLGGVLDLPRFIVFSVIGIAVGWGSSRGARRLRESEDRFARAVAGSHGSIWDVDFVARTVFFSARTRELCGLPPGPEVVPLDGWFETLPLHPEDRPRRITALEAHLSGKAPAYEGEFRLRQADGVYRWRHVRGVCVRDADGKPLRMAGSINDVDARRRAEEALRASEERISLAMEASEEGYIDCDVQTDRFIVSERMREIFEVAPDTRITYRSDFNHQFRFCSDADARAYGDAMRAMSAQGGPDRYEFEFQVVLTSGKVKWIGTRSKVTRDAEGHAMRRVGVVADITERKLAEQALRESEKRYELAIAASGSGY